MVFYLLPVFCGYILSFFKIGSLNKNRNSVKWAFYFLTAIIYCFVYMVGSDWMNYEPQYNCVSINDLFGNTILGLKSNEPGIVLLMLVFKFFNFSYYPFIIVCKLFSLFIFINFFEKFSTNVYLALTIFLSLQGTYIFVELLRFLIAMSIVLIAFNELLNNKKIKYILLILLAASFHFTAFLLFPIAFLNNLNIWVFKKRILIGIVYFGMFFLLTPDIIKSFLDLFAPAFLKPYVDTYYYRTLKDGYFIFSIGRFIYAILFIFVLSKRDYISGVDKHGKAFYIYSIYFFFILLMGSIFSTFARFAFYFFPFFCVLISWILLKFLYSKKNIIFGFFILSYFLYVPYSAVKRAGTILPYSNYLTFLFKEKPTYLERVRNFYKEKSEIVGGKKPVFPAECTQCYKSKKRKK